MQVKIYDRIESLITSLPEKDIPIGEKFLKERDFESLLELATSAMIKVKRGLKKDNPREEYLKVDLDNLNQLILEINLYCSYLDINKEKEDC